HIAAGVIGEGRTVSANLVYFDCRGGCAGNRNSRSSGRNARSLENRDTVIPLIGRAPAVFTTKVSIQIQFGGCVQLKFPERVRGSDQRLRSIRTERQIRDLGRAVSADTISGGTLKSKIQLLRQHRNTYVCANPAAVSCVVVSSD